MVMYDLINKKKMGTALLPEEINYWIQGLTKKSIPDYQTTALLMAIYFQGLTLEETILLTKAMVASGETIDLSGISGIKVDKHSTGGVGDKISLILIPLLASLGVKSGKMSGRGLGHTGGTIDKLESIPGFNTSLSNQEFQYIVNTIGCAIMGQTNNIVPADRYLYALRDVTATVDSIPLIAASIMSKKFAAGGDIIVLDVKYGSGAFMKNQKEAASLAQMMVDIGKGMGKKMAAVLTNMNQPLGFAVGNALEVLEAIEVMKGHGPQDVAKLCQRIAGIALWLAQKVKDSDTGEKLAREHLVKGAALEKFRVLIKAQKGNPQIIDQPKLLPQAKHQYVFKAEQSGYIVAMNAELVGLAAMKLGAGRSKKGDDIDPSVGIIFHKKIGDQVVIGETLAIIYANEESKGRLAGELLTDALCLENNIPKPQHLINQIILN